MTSISHSVLLIDEFTPCWTTVIENMKVSLFFITLIYSLIFSKLGRSLECGEGFRYRLCQWWLVLTILIHERTLLWDIVDIVWSSWIFFSILVLAFFVLNVDLSTPHSLL